jgi:hypothetical protein
MAKKRNPSGTVPARADVGHTSEAQWAASVGYSHLLEEIKTRIQQAQTRAVFSVNAELLRLYWDIGRMIDERQ